jgi:hypothetical protein
VPEVIGQHHAPAVLGREDQVGSGALEIGGKQKIRVRNDETRHIRPISGNYRCGLMSR